MVKQLKASFPLPQKRSFAQGRTIDKEETTVQEFKSNLNELKRLAPDEIRNMRI